MASIQQVFALADAVGTRYRLMVLLATFAGLRLGELRALRRNRIDMKAGTVQIVEQYQELSNGSLVLGPPKTEAGRRTVTIPDVLMPELEAHLATYAATGKDVLLFRGTVGQPVNCKTFFERGTTPRRRLAWMGSTSMISAIPATRWRQRPAPARRN